MTIPAADTLALWGIGFLGLFSVWKLAVAPRIARRAQATPSA